MPLFPTSSSWPIQGLKEHSWKTITCVTVLTFTKARSLIPPWRVSLICLMCPLRRLCLLNCFTRDRLENSVPITVLLPKQWDAWIVAQQPAVQQWLKVINFVGNKAGSTSLLPDRDGRLAQVLIVVNDETDFWSLGSLPSALPPGHYHYTDTCPSNLLQRAAMSWGLAAY